MRKGVQCLSILCAAYSQPHPPETIWASGSTKRNLVGGLLKVHPTHRASASPPSAFPWPLLPITQPPCTCAPRSCPLPRPVAQQRAMGPLSHSPALAVPPGHHCLPHPVTTDPLSLRGLVGPQYLLPPQSIPLRPDPQFSTGFCFQLLALRRIP